MDTKIKEEFDPSWPFNFKWGYDGQTGDAHVWRIPEGTDGQDTHRAELETLLGRPVKVGQKDALGLASYIPLERKIDGTIVAPPVVLVQSYYGTDTPEEVKQWFEKHFPGIVVRNTKTGSYTPRKITQPHPLPEPSAPHIMDRNGFGITYGYSTRKPSADWAQKRFPVGSKDEYWIGNLPSRLRKMFGSVLAGADHDGAMVAFYVPEDVGKEIKVQGGEPIEDLHITLAYFVDAAADRDDWDEAKKIIEQFASQNGPLKGVIGGFGVFHNDEDVLWASADIPGINELQHELVEALDDAGFAVSKEHSFTPHITLQYGHKGDLPKLEKPLDVTFSELTISVKKDATNYDLSGSGFVKTLSSYIRV